MLKTAVIAGGGTGGHLFPGIAVAEALAKDGVSCHFIGTARGIEAEAVPKLGFKLHKIQARGLASRPDKLIRALVESGIGIFQCIRVFSKLRPQVLISLGGYACAPAIVAASVCGVPVVMLEQNSWPGKANRFLSKLCRKACVSYPGTEKFFAGDRAVLTGNPVRQSILEKDRNQARQELNIPADRKVLLVTGASQGASSINSAVTTALAAWSDCDWTIIHLTGKTKYEEVLAEFKRLKIEGRLDYRPIGYSDQMAAFYAASDVVVARSGATTLAEITVRGLSAILVPYPYAAENHQEKNADELVKAGAAIKILDNKVADLLGDTVSSLMQDTDRRLEMERQCKQLGRPDALQGILTVIHEVTGRPTASDQTADAAASDVGE